RGHGLLGRLLLARGPGRLVVLLGAHVLVVAAGVLGRHHRVERGVVLVAAAAAHGEHYEREQHAADRGVAGRAREPLAPRGLGRRRALGGGRRGLAHDDLGGPGRRRRRGRLGLGFGLRDRVGSRLAG